MHNNDLVRAGWMADAVYSQGKHRTLHIPRSSPECPPYKRPIWSKVFIATEEGFLFIVYPCQHLFLHPTECVTCLLIFIVHKLGALPCCRHRRWVFFWCYPLGRLFSGKGAVICHFNSIFMHQAFPQLWMRSACQAEEVIRRFSG